MSCLLFISNSVESFLKEILVGEGRGWGSPVSGAWPFLRGPQASARIWVEQLEAHVGQELRAPSWSDNIANWNGASS